MRAAIRQARLGRAVIGLALWASVSGLAGCGSKVQGKIDDERPMSVRDGLWYAVGDGNNEVIKLVLTSFPRACETLAASYADGAEAYQDYYTNFNSDDLADELEQIEQEYLPEEVWIYDFTLDADPDDEEDVPDAYDIERGGDAFLTVTWRHEYTDWEQVLVDGDPDGYNADTFNADDGEIEIKGFNETGGIKGTASVELEDLDRDDAGEIEIRFQEMYCEEVEDAYEDYVSAAIPF